MPKLSHPKTYTKHQMSEYIEIEPEETNDPAVMLIHTNLRLAEQGVEWYNSPDTLAEGSAVAQALAPIEGIVQLQIDDRALTVTRDIDVPWHIIVAEITAALKEFFL